jgi:glycosyltransferase involved in cell wall biosynthesis
MEPLAGRVLKMRVLFMTATPADPDSGAAGTELRTIEALRALGHEVDALWRDSLPRRIAHGNLHYLLELPRTYRDAMRGRLALAAYDVVHASQPHGYLAAREARRLAHPPVFVHRSHGFEPRVAAALKPWEPSRGPSRRIASAAMGALLEINYRGIARHAQGHIVSSSLCARTLRDRYGVPHERIAVIAQAAPRAFGAPAAAFDGARLDRLLHVGQFTVAKAPHVLASAFAAILSRRPQATLTWVCSAAHHAQAASLLDARTRERVTLLDWMPQHELVQVYDRHGVFLFPSLFEGFGKAFIEAMARGLVVIASDEGGAHDLIRDGDNGLRVPVGDAGALADACLRVIENPMLAGALGRRGRETALEWSWERVARETAGFYRRLIDMQ